MSTPDYRHLLSSALAGLIPRGVEFSTGPIPESVDFDYEREADCLKTAGEYRKCEFIGGRECVRAALEALGFPRGPILPNADGVPVWPDGTIAAISHSRGYCAAIAAKSSDYSALGLDLEKTDRLSPAAIERTVHPGEQSFVQGEQKKASLIFCAKEAFYKAQFPLWQTHANFHDLELAVDIASGELTVRNMAERFPGELRALADQIRFRFSYVEDFVISVCWLKCRD
ncbi:hypothetical protein DDZ13_07000 [Coraliomargarita sinensis]|uniref:Enterobactin synthase component D n=1 Tax=Coraliomargarita sinensis TaxID=2174842 RepID=A0A317ZJ58_9BACT|nr:4'-phosphopantetheinyl transferase superfamily protein [Coraliomargarita sinensis]PXA04277.1 hypothetical protein DDZ13_07000 [Coraliomargarita sinensis]